MATTFSTGQTGSQSELWASGLTMFLNRYYPNRYQVAERLHGPGSDGGFLLPPHLAEYLLKDMREPDGKRLGE